MTLYLIGCCRTTTGTFFQYLILQSAGQGYDSGTFFIFLQKGFSRSPIFFIEFLLQTGKIFIDDLLCLIIGHFEFCSFKNSLYTTCKILYRQGFDPRCLEIISHTQPQGIAQLIHVFFLYIINRHKKVSPKRRNSGEDIAFITEFLFFEAKKTLILP